MTDLQRAQTLATTLPPSEERRQLAYIHKRLTGPYVSDDDHLNHAVLQRRLSDILRRFPDEPRS